MEVPLNSATKHFNFSTGSRFVEVVPSDQKRGCKIYIAKWKSILVFYLNYDVEDELLLDLRQIFGLLASPWTDPAFTLLI